MAVNLATELANPCLCILEIPSNIDKFHSKFCFEYLNSQYFLNIDDTCEEEVE